MKNNTQSRYKFKQISQNQPLSKCPSETFFSGFGERKWLKNRGKEQFINFSDKALKQLRKYFDSLDQRQNGSIGVEQLQQPFIAFGLSQNREQVQKLIQSVDLDGSGKIQFDQFLAIMLKIKRGRSNGHQQNSAMFDFFQSNFFNKKELSNGNLGQQYNKNMSFKLNVSQFRRKKILESLMSNNKEKKEKSDKIMHNFKKQVLTKPQLKDILYQSKKSNVYMYGFETGARHRV